MPGDPVLCATCAKPWGDAVEFTYQGVQFVYRRVGQNCVLGVCVRE